MGATQAYIYNNTFVDNTTGIHNYSSAHVWAINNLVVGSGAGSYVNTFEAGSDYNATDSTDDIGQGTHNRVSQTFRFVDAANDDFHLESIDGGARDYGVSLAADGYIAFSTDIDGNTRPINLLWDIGADESLLTGLLKSTILISN